MSPIFTFMPLDPMEVLYSMIFVLFSLCTIYPPLEFIAAGVTWENIFSRYLGQENLFFFEYHLRRTALLRVIWSFYIICYYCIMRCLSDEVMKSPNIQPPFTIWDAIFWFGLAYPVFVMFHTYHVWYAGGSWSGHPTCLELYKLVSVSSHPEPEQSWRSIVLSINTECRRPDKFVAGHGSLSSSWPGRRIIVTESWILVSHFTKFKVLQQSPDHLLAVVASSCSVLDTGSLTEGGRPAGENLGTRTMITVRFVNPQTGSCVLSFGLPASNLEELRYRLQCPLLRAEGVELQPTVVQQFLDAFYKVVQENGTFPVPSDMDVEQCIGCMTALANVTLVQRCDPESHSLDLHSDAPVSPLCGKCRCRPMWCLECMARWFAARQTESHRLPSTWLSGRVPCPTCRTVFCVRDVVRLTTEP